MNGLTDLDAAAPPEHSRWQRWARAVRRKARALQGWASTMRHNEPRKFKVFLFGTALMVAMFGFSLYASVAEDRAAAVVMDQPRMTLQDFKHAIDADEVRLVRRHVVRTGGAFSGVQYRTFLEVVPKTGPTHVVEQLGGLSEEVWKTLTQSAFKHPVVFEEGHNALREVPAGTWLSGGITLMLLMGVFVGAQALMGEMLSGYNFRPDRPDGKTTLDDVVLDPLVKREIREFVAQLDAAQDGTTGRHVPRGLLLDGPPGVGKTMLARAMSNELKAEFFTCTGADFVEMYVGVGPKRVRALFRQARRAPMAVIFIDEIDALGSRDQAHMDSERMATLNRLLAEMDGMNGRGNFLVVGATNHPDRLDGALKRPGRFDHKISIPLPDTDARAHILEKYLAPLPTDPAIDYRALALRTRGYAGADLRQVVEVAHKLAVREAGPGQAPRITQAHLLQGQEDALLGPGERRSTGEEARRTAVHELGHALVGHLRCSPQRHVDKVTIVGRGRSLGYTLSLPATEAWLETQEELLGQLAMMLGGRAAEQVVLGSVSNGAQDDLARANQLARQMVGQLGMGPTFGLRTVDVQQVVWPKAAEADVTQLLANAYAEAQAVIQAHPGWMTAATERLLTEETLEHEALFGADWATVDALPRTG